MASITSSSRSIPSRSIPGVGDPLGSPGGRTGSPPQTAPGADILGDKLKHRPGVIIQSLHDQWVLPEPDPRRLSTAAPQNAPVVVTEIRKILGVSATTALHLPPCSPVSVAIPSAPAGPAHIPTDPEIFLHASW